MQERLVRVVLLLALLVVTANPRPPNEPNTSGREDSEGRQGTAEGDQWTAATWWSGWSPGPEGSISWPCEVALRTLREGLSNQSLWAFQMMDSSALAPTGFIYGSTHQLGHYEECMEIWPPSSPFWGKYCLAQVHLEWKQSHSLGEGTIWNIVWTSTLVKSMNHRDRMKWGICMPAVCSSADTRDILSAHLEPMRRALQVDDKGIIVGDVSCRTMDPRKVDLNPESVKPWTRGQLSMMTFLLMLVTLALGGTIFDGHHRRVSSTEQGDGDSNVRVSLWRRLLLCFSIRRNWTWLTKARPPGETPRTFDAVHGLKTSNMLMVTVGHRTFVSLGAPIFNTQYMEDFYTRPETALIMGGTILVDTFFLMSGCLLLYGLLERKAKAKALVNVPLLYLRRYIRLVPTLMVVVAFYATVLPRIGSGPLWESRIGEERDNCLDNWWTSLLLLHTFVHPETMCVIQSWYVAVEFHAFLLCAPIAVLYCRHRRVGFYVLIMATAASILIPFAFTIAYNLDALLMPFLTVLQKLSRNETFLWVYIPTYMRATPYFLGMLCALAIRWAKKNRFKLSKWLVMVFHISSFLLCLLVCYTSWIFFRPGAPESPIASASYAVLARAGWSLAIAWQMFAPATGHAWWIGRVFAWRPLAPFGRLTYGAFLTHVGIQMYDVATITTPQNLTIFRLVTSVFSDFVLSHIIAMFLYLLIESPLASLERIILGSPSSEAPPRRTDASPNGVCLIGGSRGIPNTQPLMKLRGETTAESAH